MAETQRIAIFRRLLDDFRLDLKIAGRSLETWDFYRQKLLGFLAWLDEQGVGKPEEISPALLRHFFVDISEGRTPGGAHAYWRAVRALIFFFEREGIIDDNPFRRLRRPSYDEELKDPLPLETVQKFIDTCSTRSIFDLRDKAIFYTLIDTGVRAGELARLTVGNVDMETGAVTVLKSKNHKGRILFLGRNARRAMKAYLRARDEPEADTPLFTAHQRDGELTKFTYDGLRAIITKRAEMAGLDPPGLHAFRRTFAIEMLRSGADIMTLKRFMGHGSLSVLSRYLKQVEGDLREQHKKHSPGDAL